MIPPACRPFLAKQRRTAIERLALDDWLEIFASDVEMLDRLLPPDARHVLDIGSGLGYVSFLLFAKRRNPRLRFYLLDGDEEFDLKKTTDFWVGEKNFFNSFALSRAIIRESGLPEENFIFLNANQWSPRNLPPIDLAFSLFSWGFHYPVETYTELLKDCMRYESSLVSDIRLDQHAGYTRQVEAVSEAFRARPDVLEFNFGHPSSAFTKEELKIDLPSEFYLPSGSRLKSCRFHWRVGQTHHLFEKDRAQIDHSSRRALPIRHV